MDGFGDFLWLFFILWLFTSFMYPQLRYSSLRNARSSIIKALESAYNSKVITLIHRHERISLFGIPLYKFVVVPHYAMSGGTLIALAADEIWMDPDAVLGPVDPQISTQTGSLPAPSIVKAVREKGVDKVSDETLVLADIAEKALNQTKDLVAKLLDGKLPQDKVELVVERLVMGRYTHDWPITAEELRELGLNVKTEIPPAVYKLMSLYPQEAARRPAVEYLPATPHRSGVQQ
ncbi:MAG: hypothetical protein QXM76_02305 [Zestosphaera sp.]